MSENDNKVNNENTYSASNIQVLEGLEAVRKRPGMYIGSTSTDGLHHLVYEIVDNSIDEAMAGYCDTISVTVRLDGSVRVEDNGRGIPVAQHPKEHKSALEVVMTVLHAGGKFDDKAFAFSGGLHGVGASVVNALSEWCEAEVRRDGKIYKQSYKRGTPTTGVEVIGEATTTGTIVTFKPDAEIFSDTVFQFEILSKRLRELAFLNKGVSISLKDEASDNEATYCYEGGLISFCEFLSKGKHPLHQNPVYIRGEQRDGDKITGEIECVLQWTDAYNESFDVWKKQWEKMGRLSALYNTLSGVLSRIPLLLLLLIGGFMVIRGDILMGTLIVFVIMQGSLSESIMNLPNWIANFKVFTTNLSRIDIE